MVNFILKVFKKNLIAKAIDRNNSLLMNKAPEREDLKRK